jgi:hypothetical protein
MTIENVKDDPFQMDPKGDPPEDDEDEEEFIDADFIIHCERMANGQDCERSGVCARYLFQEGRFDICEALGVEDPLDETDVILFEGEDN